jgi:Ni/Co efflux regulator RcnB
LWQNLLTFKNKTMKKLVLSIAALALVATTMTSCKKDYTCECTATVLGMTATTSTTINDTKKNATETCDKGDATTVGAEVSCSIK